jgi:histone H3/H4
MNVSIEARNMTRDIIHGVYKHILFRAMLIAQNDHRTLITDQDIEQACIFDSLVSYVSL